MDLKNIIAAIMLSLLILPLFLALNANADGSNNDSLNSAETLSEGTVTGSVNLEGLFESADSDYYKITVPKGKDIKVIAEKTDIGDFSIKIQGYNSDKSEMSIFDIWIYLETPGETDTGSWYNGEGKDTTIYLGVSGEGDYSITISFSSDTEKAMGALGALTGICFLGTAGIICIPLFIIIVIVLIIIVIIKMRSKKKKANQLAQQQMQQQNPPQGTPQQPQQQYPPQGTPQQPQQQYPTQK